jgi:hypothetical protein
MGVGSATYDAAYPHRVVDDRVRPRPSVSFVRSSARVTSPCAIAHGESMLGLKSNATS